MVWNFAQLMREKLHSTIFLDLLTRKMFSRCCSTAVIKMIEYFNIHMGKSSSFVPNTTQMSTEHISVSPD